jgi:hypothetical protein
MTDDARDWIITELAESEHRLACDLAAMRELLNISLGLAHEHERQLARLGAQHSQLRYEYRRLRETILHDDRTAPDGTRERASRSIVSDERSARKGVESGQRCRAVTATLQPFTPPNHQRAQTRPTTSATPTQAFKRNPNTNTNAKYKHQH